MAIKRLFTNAEVGVLLTAVGRVMSGTNMCAGAVTDGTDYESLRADIKYLLIKAFGGDYADEAKAENVAHALLCMTMEEAVNYLAPIIPPPMAIEANSSQIHLYHHDEDTRMLFIKFHKGGWFVYFEVSEATYFNFKSAESIGSFFAQYIKSGARCQGWQKLEV